MSFLLYYKHLLYTSLFTNCHMLIFAASSSSLYSSLFCWACEIKCASVWSQLNSL
jgi:hypothetical protein